MAGAQILFPTVGFRKRRVKSDWCLLRQARQEVSRGSCWPNILHNLLPGSFFVAIQPYVRPFPLAKLSINMFFFFEKLSSTVLLWRLQPTLTKGWLHHHKVSSDLLIMFNEYGKPVESCQHVVKSWKYTVLNYWTRFVVLYAKMRDFLAKLHASSSATLRSVLKANDRMQTGWLI